MQRDSRIFLSPSFGEKRYFSQFRTHVHEHIYMLSSMCGSMEPFKINNNKGTEFDFQIFEIPLVGNISSNPLEKLPIGSECILGKFKFTPKNFVFTLKNSEFYFGIFRSNFVSKISEVTPENYELTPNLLRKSSNLI